jgi:hypothetical protein
MSVVSGIRVSELISECGTSQLRTRNEEEGSSWLYVCYVNRPTAKTALLARVPNRKRSGVRWHVKVKLLEAGLVKGVQQKDFLIPTSSEQEQTLNIPTIKTATHGFSLSQFEEQVYISNYT